MPTSTPLYQAGQKSKTTAAVPIGQILLRKRYISDSQLASAIARQENSGLRLGELLVAEGHVRSHHVEEALKEQQWRNQGFWVI